ncbi:MAG: GDSL-type esterase/lipase family protein, partial [Bacteroidota bacterium]
MLLNHRRLFFLLLVLFFALSISHVHAQTFSATGYSNLEDIPANDWGGSEITFDKVPGARLVIDGMGHALWQPSDVRVNFGYLETYDPDRSNGDVLISWETIGDEIEKIYNRVWVESQNAARIKVVFIGGLIYLENNDTYGRRIAHSSYWSGSPWGPQYLDAHPDPEATGWGYGDWAEEVYYIYPDGTHTRYAKVYSAFAHVGQAFDTSRLPSEGDYQFEFIEAAFQIPEGNLPNTTVNPDTSVLLADMAGNSAYIGYEPENPGLVDVLNGFAPLRYGNMMAVNMVDSPHSPFLIGLPDSTELRPYECFTNDQDCSTFYMWGAPCTYGCVSPLGHLINWDQFEKQQANQATNTPGFISNVFLQGWIPDTTSGTAFSQLGKSWITPADMNITSNGFTGGTYEVRERAYQVTKEVTGTDFTCTLQGTSATPIRNPAIVIQDWGSNTAHVTVDEVTPSDVRVGHEGNDLVVWIEYEAETNIDIAILSVPDTATFTLSTSINGTGTGNISLNPTGGTYTNGTTVTLTANPNGGSNFNNWSGDIGNNTTTTNPITITMDGNKNISANFNSCSSGTWTQVNDDDVNATYSGTWNSVTAMNGYQNDAHFTESNGASVTYSFTGTQVRLYMWAEEIAQVVNVSIDGGSDTLISIPQNPGNNVGTSIQVFQSPVLSNGNHTLTVTYVSGEVHIDAFEYFDECPTVSQIPLTTCVNGQGNISVNPSEGIYNEGTVVNLTAIPASGWQFDNWSGGASGTTNPLSFTINKKRVACVGNSITEGALLNNPPQESYPGQLQDLLGAAYEVLNFGYSGATVSNNGGLPYMSQQTYTDALASQPDIVTIMLGTNDTFDWMLMGPDFESTLTSMVQSFLDLPTNPQVILCYPPAMQGTSFDGRNSILVNNIIPIIDNIAQNLGLQTLDIYNPTVNQPAWFPDGVHPNIQGAAAIANLFNTAISNTSCVTANFSEVTTNPPPTPTLDGVFPAYYTRTSFNEHTAQISGEHADVVVKIGDVGDLVFSREFSFRPNWIYNGSSQLVGHLATINGDGPTEGNFDARCRYAYARIVENTASQVVVHWRYFPDLNNLDPTAVVHELYYINSDGSVIREYKSGTANIDEWLDENNKTTQTFNLTASGITNIQTTNGSFSAPTAVNGNPTLGAVVGSPVAHWTFDEAQGNFAAPNGTISGHKSLWKKGVSGTALGFDGYFSQVAIPATQSPVLNDNFTLDTWVVMGAFPFGNAPIVHHSSNQGQEGYYLGVNEAGQAIFIVNGVQATTSSSLPLNQWVHLVGTYGDGDMQIYVDGVASANANAAGIPSVPSTDLLIGLNNQVASPTAPVFEPQTYPSIFGFEGLIDEVVIYNSKLNQNQVTQNFNRLTDNTIKNNPDIDLRILPGQPGVASNFGATQSRLAYHDLWDNMWRASEYEDITVKFDDLPTSYVYWRGTTHGVNMVTENNLWMSDQSEEIFCGDLGFPGPPSGNPSLSEHMSDKEARYSHVRLIENTPARVVVHWRYAVADVFYDQCDERNFVDEYHTIYPDGTLYRNLRFWGNGSDIVRSDIQPLTSPGLLPADIVNSPALSIANVDGSSSDLIWNNGVPSGEDEILMANFKSNWKIYQALPSGFSAGPWGADNQSAHSTAPYAGPWNHWPVSRIVSDGRQAFDGDGRVNHFALSTGGGGTVVMYGFSNQGSTSTQDPTTVIPTVQAWRNSPPISTINGGTSQGYNVDQREYNLTLLVGSTSLDFTLNASSTNPMSNPCFVIKNWDSAGTANLQINGMTTTDFRQGIIYDTDGTRTLIIYVPTQSTSSTTFTITTNIISYQSLTLCSGDAFGGTPIYNDTTITQIFSLPSLGYDSTVVTSIVVTPIVNTQIDATICNGEAYTFGSSTFTSSGTYQNT